MKGWIAQNSGNGMITFFASKPKKFYLDHHKRIWWWVVEDNEGPSFQLTNSMTAEELAKVKFKSTGHIAFSDEHQCLYSNEQYGFNLAIVTRMNRDGMEAGRSRRWYQYKGKWYGTLKKFLEAIKDVQYINQ